MVPNSHQLIIYSLILHSTFFLDHIDCEIQKIIEKNSFTYQIFIVYLLCTKHYPKHQGQCKQHFKFLVNISKHDFQIKISMYQNQMDHHCNSFPVNIMQSYIQYCYFLGKKSSFVDIQQRSLKKEQPENQENQVSWTKWCHGPQWRNGLSEVESGQQFQMR